MRVVGCRGEVAPLGGVGVAGVWHEPHPIPLQLPKRGWGQHHRLLRSWLCKVEGGALPSLLPDRLHVPSGGVGSYPQVALLGLPAAPMGSVAIRCIGGRSEGCGCCLLVGFPYVGVLKPGIRDPHD